MSRTSRITQSILRIGIYPKTLFPQSKTNKNIVRQFSEVERKQKGLPLNLTYYSRGDEEETLTLGK